MLFIAGWHNVGFLQPHEEQFEPGTASTTDGKVTSPSVTEPILTISDTGAIFESDPHTVPYSDSVTASVPDPDSVSATVPDPDSDSVPVPDADFESAPNPDSVPASVPDPESVPDLDSVPDPESVPDPDPDRSQPMTGVHQ